LDELPEEGIPGDEVRLALGLAHAGGGEGDDDGVVAEEGDDGDAAQLHVELLLLLLVDLALRLVHLEEVLDHRLVHVVADRVLDLLHVEVELVLGPPRRVRVVVEQLTHQPLGLVLLEQEGHHLVHQVGHDVPVFIFPFSSKI
jgi:hypothetical protein